LLQCSSDERRGVGRDFRLLVGLCNGVVGSGVGVDGRLQLRAKYGEAGDGFAELRFVLRIGFLAARHGGDHRGKTSSHGGAGGGGAASSRRGGGSGELLNEGRDAGAEAADGQLAAHHGGEAVLQNQRRVEVFNLKEPLGGLLQRELGDEADDFARNGRSSVTCGLAADQFKDAMDGRLLEVSEVHGDLGHAAHQETSGLDVAQTA
jgi:hypothetical protein